jgi:hypothetical protein
MQTLKALYNDPMLEGMFVFLAIAAALVVLFLVVVAVRHFMTSSEEVSPTEATRQFGEFILEDSALQTIEVPVTKKDGWPMLAKIGVVTATLGVISFIAIWSWPTSKTNKQPAPEWTKPVPESDPTATAAPHTTQRKEFFDRVAKAKQVDVPDIQPVAAEVKSPEGSFEMSPGQCRIYASPGVMVYFKKYSRAARNMKLTRSIRAEEPQGGPGGYLTKPEDGEMGAEITPPTGCFVDRGSGKEPCVVIDDITAIALCKRK